MDAFLCPNGTLFNQQVFVCDWWYNVDCNAAPNFYSRNQFLYSGPGVGIDGGLTSLSGRNVPVSVPKPIGINSNPFVNQVESNRLLTASSNTNTSPAALIPSPTPTPRIQVSSSNQNQVSKKPVVSINNHGANKNIIIGSRSDIFQPTERPITATNRPKSVSSKVPQFPLNSIRAPPSTTTKPLPARSTVKSLLKQNNVAALLTSNGSNHFLETLSELLSNAQKNLEKTIRTSQASNKRSSTVRPAIVSSTGRSFSQSAVSTTGRPFEQSFISSTSQPFEQPFVSSTGRHFDQSNIDSTVRPSQVSQQSPQVFRITQPTNGVNRSPSSIPNFVSSPTRQPSSTTPEQPNSFDSLNLVNIQNSLGQRSNQFSNVHGQRENMYESPSELKRLGFKEYPYSPSQKKTKLLQLQAALANKNRQAKNTINDVTYYGHGQRGNVYSQDDESNERRTAASAVSYIANNQKRVVIDHTNYAKRNEGYVNHVNNLSHQAFHGPQSSTTEATQKSRETVENSFESVAGQKSQRQVSHAIRNPFTSSTNNSLDVQNVSPQPNRNSLNSPNQLQNFPQTAHNTNSRNLHSQSGINPTAGYNNILTAAQKPLQSTVHTFTNPEKSQLRSPFISQTFQTLPTTQTQSPRNYIPVQVENGGFSTPRPNNRLPAAPTNRQHNTQGHHGYTPVKQGSYIAIASTGSPFHHHPSSTTGRPQNKIAQESNSIGFISSTYAPAREPVYSSTPSPIRQLSAFPAAPGSNHVVYSVAKSVSAATRKPVISFYPSSTGKPTRQVSYSSSSVATPLYANQIPNDSNQAYVQVSTNRPFVTTQSPFQEVVTVPSKHNRMPFPEHQETKKMLHTFGSVGRTSTPHSSSTSKGQRTNPFLAPNKRKKKTPKVVFSGGVYTTTVNYPTGTSETSVRIPGLKGGDKTGTRKILDFSYTATYSSTPAPSNSNVSPVGERSNFNAVSTTSAPKYPAYRHKDSNSRKSSSNNNGKKYAGVPRTRYAGAIKNKSTSESTAILVEEAESEAKPTIVSLPPSSRTSRTRVTLAPVATVMYGRKLSSTARRKMTGAWQSYFTQSKSS